MDDPTTNPIDQLALDGGADAVDFNDQGVFFHEGISPERWERAHDNPPVKDLLADLFGLHGSPLSCPFHGRDSKPSFYVYPRSNDCYCFGCGEGPLGYWDNLKLVAAHFGWVRTFGSDEVPDRVQALKWLEKNYDMPVLTHESASSRPDIFILDDTLGDTEAEQDPLLAYRDVPFTLLREPYIRAAIVQVSTAAPEDRLELAKELIERRFRGEKEQDAVSLLRVIPKHHHASILQHARHEHH